MKLRRLIFFSGMMLVTAALAWVVKQQAQRKQTVVVYVSEDQMFAEPILKDFQRDTGIRVKAVYDTEETKSTGVAFGRVEWIGQPC